MMMVAPNNSSTLNYGLEPVETTELVTGTEVETIELDNVIGLELVETTELVAGIDDEIVDITELVAGVILEDPEETGTDLETLETTAELDELETEVEVVLK